MVVYCDHTDINAEGGGPGGGILRYDRRTVDDVDPVSTADVQEVVYAWIEPVLMAVEVYAELSGEFRRNHDSFTTYPFRNILEKIDRPLPRDIAFNKIPRYVPVG